MPVLIIAVVFFAIFLAMGVILFRAMASEHRGLLFSRRWADRPRQAKAK